MKTATVAPRWATWALILLGAAEIPWVIYLVFFQDPVVHASHVRLVTVGLGVACLVACLFASWGIWQRSRWAPVAAVSAATVLTFTATLGKLSPGLQVENLLGGGPSPLLLAAPAVIAGIWGARSLLGTDVPVGRRPLATRVAAIVLLLTVIPLAFRIAQHSQAPASDAVLTQARALVVLLDSGEVVGLLGAGLASLRGRVRPTLVLATMAGVLLACDAWTNVVGTTGEAFNAALVFLIVGEIPSMLVCLVAVVAAYRKLPRVAAGPAPTGG